MTTIYLYRVFCIEENQDITIWTRTKPTQCPNIHNDRTIDQNRTVILSHTNPDFFKIYPEFTKLNKKNYSVISKFEYAGSNNIGSIQMIEIMSHTENSNTSYDLRIYNPNASTLSEEILVEKTNLNNEESQIIDLGEINNVPSEKSILEIQCKNNSGNKNIIISEIIIYYAKLS